MRYRRRTIYFPVTDNDGNSLDAENAQVRTELAQIAPGWTEDDTPKNGVWYDGDGTRYEDKVREVAVTSPSEVDGRIKAKLPEWRDLLRQQALYSDAHDVDFDIV